jgi:filamentous hemagglutinin family protein
MNHIYRLVWSEIANTWLAVAEIAKGRGKRSSTVGASPKLDEATEGWAMPTMPVLSLSKRPDRFDRLRTGIARPALSFTQSCALLPLTLALSIIGAPAHALDVGALPTGGSVTAGSAAISQAANVLTVQQVSQRAAIDWKSFNIGASATVNFNQPNANAVALNRIGGNSASEIYGKLNANGQVFFSNPNGMLFARGAQVNVGGILATTMSIGNSDFMAGNTRFTNPGTGSIRNEGIINALGSVALIGNTTHNAGQIIATTVTLAAGNTVAIDLTADGLIRARVEDAALKASIENSGSIDGAQITLTAGQAREALDRVVNNSGIIRAIGLTMKGGEILLEGAIVENTGSIVASGANGGGTIKLLGDMGGGTVKVGGTLDASAPATPSPLAGEGGANGGFIETSAAHVQMADTARITTAAPNGKTGTWLIDPNDYTIAASGGDITGTQLSTNLGSNNVIIVSSSGATAGNGDINVNDAVSWSINTLTLTAARDVNINAVMTASGTSALALNPATANGADGAVAGGAVKAGFNTDGTFRGRVDFGARSGTGFLTINGNGYTVINSLGAAGSTTGSDLQGIQGNLAGRYALGDNIDASTTSGWNGGLGFVPLGDGNPITFTGAFDGLGHTITGLAINRPAESNVALFGNAIGAAIRNVGLVGSSMHGITYIGTLAGWFYLGTIANSYATGSVTGNNMVGGLVGGSQLAAIYSSYSTSGVTASDPNGTHAGGLVGYNNGTITNSYATGTVTAPNRWSVGGLVGYHDGTITDSYSTGSVSGIARVGGLVGWNNGGVITNSYSAGSVSGTSNVGGLVGYGGGTITSSYWDTQTSSQATSVGGAGKTTAEMMQLATFSGWDFTNTWRIVEGASYPTLRVFWVPPPPSTDNTWLGLLDSYWTTVGNWSLGHVPIATETVLIPDVAGTAFIQMADGTYTVKNITSAELFKLTGSGTSFTLTQSGAFNAGLDLGAGTSLTSQGTLSLSSYTLGSGAKINLTQSGTGILTIGGLSYTVINSLGAAGSATAADLQGMSGSLSGRYALGSNIDASATSSWNAAAGFLPVGDATNKFTGIFDGLGHTITGTTINRPSIDYVGLFGYTNGAAISNVGLVGGSVTGNSNVGGLAGVNDGTIRNSYNTGSVSGSDIVGGLVGMNYSGAISNSYATGSVTSLGNSGWVGGLVGYNMVGTISNSYSVGTVNGAGGLAGGLVGYVFGGAITNSFWNTETSAQSTCLSSGNRDGCSGLGTVGMTQQASFTGWDFSTVWGIDEDQSYPYLRTPNQILAPVIFDNTWLGLLDNYWTTAGNWSLGHVPTAVEAVKIPDVAGTAFIQMADGAYTVKNITSVELFKLTGTGTSFTLTNDGRFKGGLNLGADTSLTSQGTLSLSSYTLGSGAKISITQSGTDILTIGGLPYVVINSVGAAGSITGIDLQGMNGNLAARYALGSNIDASATSSWNSGAGFLPVGNAATGFGGAFDELGHSVTGLTINRSATFNVGLFGYTSGGAISNVGLIGGSVTGDDNVGGLAGFNMATIGNSYSTISVHGTGSVGGLVGVNSGTISNSYSTGSVAGIEPVGGLAGFNAGGSIANSFSTGTVTGSRYVGGLMGRNGSTAPNQYSDIGGTIANSYSTGSVVGGTSVGGLLGFNDSGTIANSYSTGSVSGFNNIGGLVGEMGTGTITNTYRTGALFGWYDVGGLVGRNGSIDQTPYNNSGGTITNSYWNEQAAGGLYPGVGITFVPEPGVTGITTAQMKDSGNFSGWDFATVWNIDQGASFPYLRANTQNPHPTALTFMSMSLTGATALSSTTASAIQAIATVIQQTALTSAPSAFVAMTESSNADSQIAALNPTTASDASTGSWFLNVTIAGITLQKPADEVVRLAQPKGSMLTCRRTSL